MKLKVRELLNLINVFLIDTRRNRLDIYSACAAFFVFISFIPFLICVLSAIPYLPISREELIALFLEIVPKEYSGFAENIMTSLYSKSIAVLSVSAVTMLWSAGKGLLGIIKGLNEIHNVKDSRNWLVMRLRGTVYTIILIVMVLLMIIVNIFGNEIINIIEGYLPDIRIRFHTVFSIKDWAMLVVLFLVTLYFYVVLPDKKIRIRDQIIGALASSGCWIMFTKLFSVYLSEFGSFSMYGSFAALIILMLWLYFGMNFVFMGASLNVLLKVRKGCKNEGQD